MPVGHVYILANASMPGLLKIGMTVRTPEERAAEVSRGTGVPSPFMVAYSEKVPDCFEAERLIHRRLDRFRPRRNREFFQLPLKDAISELARIAEEVRRSTSVASQAAPSPFAPPAVAPTVTAAGGTQAETAVGCLAASGYVVVPVMVPLVWLYVVVPTYNAIAVWGGKFWIVLAAVLTGVGVLMWGWAAVRAERRASK